ncbi:hypothetical protein HMPREF9999_02095 [Alloprevotella sp. oral taxon 473 str. F0040]|nr:hypothetical protein HMPREF9999_02095 [Alloprevotella sp. oral taxon 473 str. F0040]
MISELLRFYKKTRPSDLCIESSKDNAIDLVYAYSTYKIDFYKQQI